MSRTFIVEAQNTVSFTVEVGGVETPEQAVEVVDNWEIDQLGDPNHLDDWRYVVIDGGETVLDTEGPTA